MIENTVRSRGAALGLSLCAIRRVSHLLCDTMGSPISDHFLVANGVVPVCYILVRNVTAVIEQ